MLSALRRNLTSTKRLGRWQERTVFFLAPFHLLAVHLFTVRYSDRLGKRLHFSRGRHLPSHSCGAIARSTGPHEGGLGHSYRYEAGGPHHVRRNGSVDLAPKVVRLGGVSVT